MSLTARWVRAYTAGLPQEVRSARLAEVASDVYEQLAAAGDQGRRRARRAVVGRTVRGAVDDLVWRREVARAMTRTRSIMAVLTQAWWAPLAVLVGLFDAAFGVAVLSNSESTMPGRILGPALALAAALSVAIGLSLRASARPATGSEPSSRRATLAGVVVLLALAAIAVGGGLVVVVAGSVVIFAALVVAVLSLGGRRGTAAADGLVLLGTLPALGSFWLVGPTLVAFLVIVGIVTSRPRAVPARA